MILAALAVLLFLQLPVTGCHAAAEPLLAIHQAAPIQGVPVLVDGAAVSLQCKF